MQFNLEKKTISIVGLFALGAAITIAGVIWPTINYIHKIDLETETLRLYLQKKYDATISLRSSVHKIAQIKSAVDAYNDRLFRPGKELLLITTLEKLAAQNNVVQKINSAGLDKVVPGQPLSLSINISGNYLDTLKYLADLKSLNFFLITESAQWSPLFDPAQPTGVAKTAMYLNLSLYVNP